ncbi:MAG: hypothetical protein R8F63_09450 [Acidimicrobiales bacterium]|nr:hypothetical protein [Acidimicrobiales bacterium]
MAAVTGETDDDAVAAPRRSRPARLADLIGIGREAATKRLTFTDDRGEKQTIHFRRFIWEPVERQPIRHWIGAIALLVVLGSAALFEFADTKPVDGAHNIVDFELAGSADRIQEVVNGEAPGDSDARVKTRWTENDADAIRRQLLFDFGFAAGYAVLLAYLCGVGRRNMADPWAVALGRHAGLAALLAGGFDMVENLGLLFVLEELSFGATGATASDAGGVVAAVAATFAWAKFVLIAVALVYAFVGVLAWIWGFLEWMLPGVFGAEPRVVERGPDEAENRRIQEWVDEAQLTARVGAAAATAALTAAEAALADARSLRIVLQDAVAAGESADLDAVVAARRAETLAQVEVDKARSVSQVMSRREARVARVREWARLSAQRRRTSDAGVQKRSRRWYIEGLQTRPVVPAYGPDRERFESKPPAGLDPNSWESASIELRNDWSRKPVEGRMGISASGGGIRSASFHLGVYQALQEDDLLRQSRYLASVSGGGYITGAMTTLRRESDARLLADEAPFAPLSPEERLLRNRTTYLAPKAWNKFLVFLRFLLGLGHNFAFLVLTVWLVAVPVAAVSRMSFLHPDLHAPGYDLWWSVPLIVVTAVSFGVAMRASRRVKVARAVDPVNALPTARARRGVAVAVAAVLFSVAVFVPLLVTWVPQALAWVAQALFPDDLLADDTQAAAVTGATEITFIGVLKLLGVTSLIGNAVAAVASRNKKVLGNIAAWIVVPGVVFGTIWYAVTSEWNDSVTIWLITLGTLVVLFLPGDQNRRTFHPFYKARLESAFGLRRILMPNGKAAASTLETDRFWSLSRYGEDPDDRWPQTIFCAAANITTADVSPAGRGAVGFTFSSTEIGGPVVGYCQTEHFESVVSSRLHRNATLPAAVAISGAAVSPSMGRLTLPAVTSLLALFNLRLGVWTPHPDSVARAKLPGGWARRPRANYLLNEVLRRHNLEDTFLYVTDGGHIDNLGLVELLRRGCTAVMAFDAGGDDIDSFKAVGETIALARAELGVEIILDPSALDPEDIEMSRESPAAVVSGTIHYPDGTRGIIVFAKTAVVRAHPWDVRSFGRRDKKFPSHSTVNQLFDGQKFESYRALGHLTGATAAQEFRRMAELHNIPIGYVN